jgi:antitoxin (DNA-binding transcriptional repressor) of toxin-antitoxin stability system
MIYYSVMIKLNIHEIKTQLSKYIDLVEAGETVLVCKRNIPVAEIRSLEKAKQKRKPVLGWAEGQGKVSPSFDEPMSRVELSLWEQGDAGDPLRKYAPKPAKRTK